MGVPTAAISRQDAAAGGIGNMSDVVTINLGLILLIASVVAMISRRMRLP
jgi:hypothetical protein